MRRSIREPFQDLGVLHEFPEIVLTNPLFARANLSTSRGGIDADEEFRIDPNVKMTTNVPHEHRDLRIYIFNLYAN